MKKSFVPWVVLALFAFVLMAGGCGGGGGGGGSAVSIDGTWKIVKSEGTDGTNTVTGITNAAGNVTPFTISVTKTTKDDFDKIQDAGGNTRGDFYTVTLGGKGLSPAENPFGIWGIKGVTHATEDTGGSAAANYTTRIIGLPTFKRVSSRKYQSRTTYPLSPTSQLKVQSSGGFFQEFKLVNNDTLKYYSEYNSGSSVVSIDITLKRQ